MRNFFRIFLFEIIASIIAFIAWVCFKTSRIEFKNISAYNNFLKSKKPCIVCTWHGRLFPLAFMDTGNKKFSAIISRHNDGEIIARIIAKFGFGAIRGSTNRLASEDKTAKNRGGAYVLKATLKELSNGNNIAITPDGPKGPARKVKSNFFAVASRADAVILPMSFSCSNAIRFKTWDNFIFPLPFSKITIIFGDEIIYDKNIYQNEIEFTNKVEETLNQITDESDLVYKK
ncbi:MAG: lysophospholipid acyltransferase family protein [Rickettsiales bacterium]|nr:lysophospholipid acyltransferase family protein [Rickettsiales bacterium]